MKTIAFGGQMQQAKDVSANYLNDKLNEISLERWTRNAFANKVKETFEMAFGKDREWVEKWKVIPEAPPGFNKNIRQCLIDIGDGFRKMQPNIWIERVFDNQKHNQVLSDARYINECNFIRERGGMTILIWRKGYQNNLQNESEQQFVPFVEKCLQTNQEGIVNVDMPFDLFIRNEGSIEDLYRKIDNIIIPYIKKEWTDCFENRLFHCCN